MAPLSNSSVARDMRVDLDRQHLPHQRFACRCSLREGHTRRAGNARYRSHQIDQSRQIIGTHIKEGTATLEVIEAGVGMPAFRTVTEEESGRGHWRPNPAIVDGFARSLSAAAEEGIRRAAQPQTSLPPPL